jgi:glycosyltransferase involved in cell wall biosynthesis
MTGGPRPWPPTLVSVVIPARNAADVIGQQLTALAGQDYDGRYEVVVADNGSTDDLAGAVEPFTTRLSVRVVPADDRPGVSHARNVGCRAAEGDLIAICDADDEVSPGWLSAHVAAAAGADVLGGSLELERLNPPRTVRWRDVSTDSLSMAMGFLPFAQGCNVALWRWVLDAVGGWDEDLVAGGDDTDFAWRAQLAGATLDFAPDALVHYRLRTSLRATMRQVSAYAEARASLVLKHRAHGARGTTASSVGRRVWWLVTRAPYLLMPGSWRQGRWLVRAAALWGGVRASWRHRVWTI